ncbi:related to glutathione-S-transferase [Lecanosticta acicola]|uniref:Related to glutathione-S-transferase n=1 Tax=Lecanosticta acicola TaxID=111012 RepID=A0AAI8Z428_9PEZI|nr:related to glutathione-S-transferase [Lecanosticta acicola]
MSTTKGHTNGQQPRKELDPNQGGDPNKKTYHKQATGEAWKTVQAHAREHDLQLYGSCFCPFVHRVWISLELKGLDYQYIEVDVYRKPKLLLDINPRGLVPALRHGGDWGCYESTVLMEYLEDLHQGRALLPQDPKLRASSRLWSDHINRHIIPNFYKYLQAQRAEDQIRFAGDLKEQISKAVDAADPEGPFFLGAEMSFVDVQLAPWIVRLEKVLKPYRGWPDPEPGSRWEKWVRAVEQSEPVRKTTSDDGLYLDSYERYAENRPNTSQVREAINSGGGLP